MQSIIQAVNEQETPRYRSPFVLIGKGYYLRRDQVVAVLRAGSRGARGPNIVVRMIRDSQARWEEQHVPPRVWDLTGRFKRRSAVVTLNGDIYLSRHAPKVLVKRIYD